jgi:hypothetical protein
MHDVQLRLTSAFRHHPRRLGLARLPGDSIRFRNPYNEPQALPERPLSLEKPVHNRQMRKVFP